MDRATLAILVGAHVLSGLVGLAAAITAMVSRKGGRLHRRAGRVWLGGLAGLCVTAPVLAGQDWRHLGHLVPLAGVAAVAAIIGHLAARRGRPTRTWHITGMAGSFIAALTAFYVDNGPRLPLWDQLPPLALWVLPTAVGLPLTVRAVVRELRVRTERRELRVVPMGNRSGGPGVPTAAPGTRRRSRTHQHRPRPMSMEGSRPAPGSRPHPAPATTAETAGERGPG